jgi:hypothetical protein
MTMWHPTEDELVEHLSGDPDRRERQRIDAHLVACGDCRQVAEEVNLALSLVETTVPEPPDGFERVMWARIQRAIETEAAPSPWYASFGWRQWVPLASFAALAVVGSAFALRPAPGVVPTGAEAPIAVASADGDADDLQERVLYTALDDHFQQAEMLLVEVRNASERDSLTFESAAADELISAGRLYRHTAEYTGQQRVVQVLDDLEPVLVEVARSPEPMNAGARQWLRARIDEDALLFKVRVAANDARDRVSNPN